MAYSQLYKLDTPSVSLLNYGEKNTLKGEAVFSSLVLKIVKFFGGNWTDPQIIDCGKVLYNEGYYLTFAELAHFAQKAKAGGFKVEGQALVYGQFTTITMIDWFSTYIGENLKQRGEHSEKRPTWVEPENPVSPERMSELIAEFEVQITAEKEAERKEEIEKREKAIYSYNEMLKKQVELRNKVNGRTSTQVPDNCINDIPHE